MTLSPYEIASPLLPAPGVPTFDTMPAFEIWVDMLLSKSFTDKKTGRIWVRGIASDNSADFQRDVVAMQGVQEALEILSRGWGKFNFEHHDEVVGEVTRIAFIDADTARAKYGAVCEGSCLEIEGFVYAVTPQTPPHSDIREIHKLIAAGARLGFSLQGGPVKRQPMRGADGKVFTLATPTFVNKVAITGQPVNMNTLCLPFAKSMAAIFGASNQLPEPLHEPQNGADVAGDLAPHAPAVLLMGDNSFWKDVGAAAPSGALSSGGAQAVVGSEGGDATRLGAADPANTPCICAHCDSRFAEKSAQCPSCGAVTPWLKKSMQAALLPLSGAREKELLESFNQSLRTLRAVFG